MIPELLARLVLAATINVMAAQRAVKTLAGLPEEDNGAIEALNAARATLDALAVAVESMVPAGDDVAAEPPKPNTDDPSTCGHGSTLKVINETMCATCGAIEQEDGTWVIL